MDGPHFDRLTRHMARRTTRRSVAGGLAALLTGLVAPRDGSAACPPDQVPTAGNRCVCRTTGRPPGPEGCPCPAGQTRCDGICVNLSTDVAHCGVCGHRCPEPAPGTCQQIPVCAVGTCTHTPLPQGTIYRPVAGDCDVAEVCDGQRLDCPPDRFLDAGTVCRASTGPCDPEERCTGDSPLCPADVGVGGGSLCGTVCCVPPETCVVAPPGEDGVRCAVGGGNGQPCRASGATCDPGLMCDTARQLCLPCGGATESCCFDGAEFTCAAGLTCHVLMTWPEPGQPPVTACEPCGGVGDICCGPVNGIDGTCPTPGTTCVVAIFAMQGICQACGEQGEVCCGATLGSWSGTCAPGTTCTLNPEVSLYPLCQPCGGLEEVCCGGDMGYGGTCDPGLGCTVDLLDSARPVCRECGGRNEQCCLSFVPDGGPPTPVCASGLICSIELPNSAICLAPEDCGSAGQRCCGLPNDTSFGRCDSGLTCVNEGENVVCR